MSSVTKMRGSISFLLIRECSVIGILKGGLNNGIVISPVSLLMMALYAFIASLPIRNPAAHLATIWNSIQRHRILAAFFSPRMAAALGKYTGRTTYPETVVLLSPMPWNVGLRGDGRISALVGTRASAIRDGPPESTTPEESGVS